MNLADTIAAVATAAGNGAVAMIRVSGQRARTIAEATFRSSSGAPLRGRRVTHGHIVDGATGRVVDEVVVAWLPAPRTYTREPMFEVTCHGGRAATAAVFQALVAAGARVAEPGEFTLRAFLNGRIDLAQAEAVRDAVSARSADGVATAVAQANGALSRVVRGIRDPLADLAAQIEGSLDFADDGVPDVDRALAHATLTTVSDRLDALLATAGPGRVLRHGLRAVLAGETNAGKSTLFNALLGSDRAITSSEAGTTRDVIEEVVAIGAVAIVLIDTAGWRRSSDGQTGEAERFGLARTEAAIREADVVLHVVDGTSATEAKFGRERISTLAPNVAVIEVWTRADLRADTTDRPKPSLDYDLWVSAVTGEGLEALRSALHRRAQAGSADADRLADGEVLTNTRQVEALGRARDAVGRALEGLTVGLPDDLLGADVRAAVAACGEVTGETVGEDVLARVFRSFCIGK
jgi:tRNA modification GTPase